MKFPDSNIESGKAMNLYAKPCLRRLAERQIGSARRKFGIPARVPGCAFTDSEKVRLMRAANTRHFPTALYVAGRCFIRETEARRGQ